MPLSFISMQSSFIPTTSLLSSIQHFTSLTPTTPDSHEIFASGGVTSTHHPHTPPLAVFEVPLELLRHDAVHAETQPRRNGHVSLSLRENLQHNAEPILLHDADIDHFAALHDDRARHHHARDRVGVLHDHLVRVAVGERGGQAGGSVRHERQRHLVALHVVPPRDASQRVERENHRHVGDLRAGRPHVEEVDVEQLAGPLLGGERGRGGEVRDAQHAAAGDRERGHGEVDGLGEEDVDGERRVVAQRRVGHHVRVDAREVRGGLHAERPLENVPAATRQVRRTRLCR